MEHLLEKIQARLNEGAYPNEASVSFSIVMPILRALGWDDSDPDQVLPEYANGNRRVDFALCGRPRRPSVFVEVKGVGRAIEGDRQLFEYAFHEGVPLCLLTDGREWSFYLPSGQGSYDDRRVYRLQINERSAVDCAEILKRYLQRARVKSEDALEAARNDYRDLASQREAGRVLPKAWQKLVEEPEDLLVELLSDQTEAISGFRPMSEEVTRFLRSLSVANDAQAVYRSVQPTNIRPTSTGRNLSKPDRPPALAGRSIDFVLFGSSRTATNATLAMVEILIAIAKRHPTKIAEISKAVRGKSRNHIAKTPAEIYPARPDLARAVEFAPGWLVGLNIANREKLRIVREACRVTSTKFGSEIAIDFPNADA